MSLKSLFKNLVKAVKYEHKTIAMENGCLFIQQADHT